MLNKKHTIKTILIYPILEKLKPKRENFHQIFLYMAINEKLVLQSF